MIPNFMKKKLQFIFFINLIFLFILTINTKKLLADAGYPNGFEVELRCPNDRYVNDEAICTAVVGMFGKIGINVASLKSALETHKDKISNKIKKNRDLAAELGINGTPAFIVGNKLIPGAVDIEDIKDAIKQARSQK